MPVTEYISVPEAAKTLRVATRKVRGWIDAGELKAADISNGNTPRWRINRSDLHEFLAKRSRSNQEL